MPLLRSRLEVRRSRFRFVGRMFVTLLCVLLVFGAVVAGRYVFHLW